MMTIPLMGVIQVWKDLPSEILVGWSRMDILFYQCFIVLKGIDPVCYCVMTDGNFRGSMPKLPSTFANWAAHACQTWSTRWPMGKNRYVSKKIRVCHKRVPACQWTHNPWFFVSGRVRDLAVIVLYFRILDQAFVCYV